MQEQVMEGNPDLFKTNDVYYKLFPRPNYDSYRALDLDMLEHGQIEPIKVNPDFVILDGYSRYEILSNRGTNIKYTIIDVDDEIKYIVSLNLMRRSLNDYQKIESMYTYYKKLKTESREKTNGVVYDVLFAIDNGHNTAKKIAEFTGHNVTHVQRILVEYTRDYSLSKERGKALTGGSKPWEYTINVRGKAILAKGQPNVVKGVDVFVGKLIGVSSTQLRLGINLVEKAPFELKQRLREGKISIGNAILNIGQHGTTIKTPRVVWSKYAQIRCKHCKHVSLKDGYEVIGTGR